MSEAGVDVHGGISGRFSSFTKHDSDKPRTDLLPGPALLEIARVLAFGARKYDDNNWLKCDSSSRYTAAALRHLLAWQWGEDDDDESGLSHLAHAGCCILFALSMDLMGLGDRRSKTLAPSLQGRAEKVAPSGDLECVHGVFHRDDCAECETYFKSLLTAWEEDKCHSTNTPAESAAGPGKNSGKSPKGLCPPSVQTIADLENC